MKKILVTLLISLCTVGMTFAQDLEKATELYNTAATALGSNDNKGALDLFEQALTMAETLGDEGVEIASKCKDIIPQLYMAIGKEFATAKDIDNAIATLKKAVEVATKFGADDVIAEAKDLMPQLLMADANGFLKEKKYPEAADAYKKVLEIDATNGMAMLRLGQVYAALNQVDEAVEVLTQAVDNGQEADAKKQLSNIFVKKAAACQKAKDLKGALEAAQKSVEYLDNANGQKIIGLSALSLKQNKVAADAIKAYLAMSPNAKDKVQMIYQLGTALQALGENAEACGYFKEISQDAKWGEAARYQITVLKCK